MTMPLLNNLPSFFDREPQKELALRIRHADGLTWKIERNTLTLTPGAGQPESLDLTQITLAELVGHVQQAGFEVAYQNNAMLSRQASVLLDGQGDQSLSNGDHLYGFRSILWAHIQALQLALTDANGALSAMLKQLVIKQATEQWADYWGQYFDVVRRQGESDTAYTQRIIDEFYRARNNPIAMRQNVKRFADETITLFEPWQHMWTLSRSALSDVDHFPSGDYYAYHWIQPVISYLGADWPAIRAILEADRPAGTQLLDPRYELPPFYIDGGHEQRNLFSAGHPTQSENMRIVDYGILSHDLIPSDYEVVKNHPITIFDWFVFQVHAFSGPLPSIAYHRTFCLGEIVLSEHSELDSQQAHTPGREWIETGAPLELSSMPLSGYDHSGYWQPIDEWIFASQGARATLGESVSFLTGRRATKASSTAAIAFPSSGPVAGKHTHATEFRVNLLRTWDAGVWDDTPWSSEQRQPALIEQTGNILILTADDGTTQLVADDGLSVFVDFAKKTSLVLQVLTADDGLSELTADDATTPVESYF